MSSYQELYHIEAGDKSYVTVIEDTGTGKWYLRKELSIYSRDVYQWLIDNPDRHVPKVVSITEENGKLILIEEYIKGETLETLLNEGRLTARDKRKVIEDVCDAVIYLHQRKPPIIHRDIKPANIIVDKELNVVLIDFDASRIFVPGMSHDTELLGTQGNAAPEQYGFAQSDVRTDVFAIGVLIKELFPKDHRMLKIAKTATEISPKDRYSSVLELKERILHRKDRDLKDNPNATEHFCTNCGAILESQPGFEFNDGTWVCTECGQMLFGDEAGDTGGKMNGVIWYCDGCNTILNKQEGFDYYDDTWTCTKCGFVNDISEGNIVPPPLTK